MRADELMGVAVETGPAGFEVDDPALELSFSDGLRFLAARDRAILRVPAVGTFAVRDGATIRLDSEPGVAPETVSAWLHGTVAALLLAQRGRFALHASVVEVGGAGVAVSGERGAGKSTTALRLAQRGHRLVTDDVSPLEPGERVSVHPFARPVHVFAGTAAELGLDVSHGRPLLAPYEKLALPAPAGPPAELAAIVVLATGDGAAGMEPARVRGARAPWLVNANAYRVDLLGDLCRNELFEWAGAVAARVPVHELTRPPDGWTVDAVADAVERLAARAPDT